MDIACVGKFSTKISGGQIVQRFIHKDGFSVNNLFIEPHPAQLLKKFSRRCIHSYVAKPKSLIVQLICAFAFTYAKREASVACG